MAGRIRRRVSRKVVDKVRKRTGRKLLADTNRDTGARWPGLTVPLVASLSAVAAFKLPGDTAGIRLLRGATALGVAASWATQLFVRPWQLTWGATDTELRLHMPGDALVPHPWLEATRAVTIDAPASVIWPWLEGLDVLPGALRGEAKHEVITRERALVRSLRIKDQTVASAAIRLEALSEEHTRLVLRLRVAGTLAARTLLSFLLLDRDFAHTRRQLLSIKQVAEREWLGAGEARTAHPHPLQSPNAPAELPGLHPADATGRGQG